jgi:hypothetical protein
VSGRFFRKRAPALLAALLAAAAGAVLAPRAYAYFTADDASTSMSAESGTLVMDLKVGSNDCFSYKGTGVTSNSNSSCAAMYSSPTELYPGDSAQVTVTITNDGSVSPSDFRVYMPGGCTTVLTSDVPPGQNGGGNPCGATGWSFSIADTTTTTTCLFPVSQTGACPVTAGSLATFATRSTLNSGFTLGTTPAPGKSRTFQITLAVPSTADNTLQGESPSFALAWHMTS